MKESRRSTRTSSVGLMRQCFHPPLPMLLMLLALALFKICHRVPSHFIRKGTDPSSAFSHSRRWLLHLPVHWSQSRGCCRYWWIVQKTEAEDETIEDTYNVAGNPWKTFVEIVFTVGIGKQIIRYDIDIKWQSWSIFTRMSSFLKTLWGDDHISKNFGFATRERGTHQVRGKERHMNLFSICWGFCWVARMLFRLLCVS